MRADRMADALMIFVDPVQFVAIKHVQVDQTAIDRRQGQRLEGIHGLLGTCDVGADNQFQVFDPDAVGVGLVIAGLVGQDHAAPQRCGAELGNSRRTLMHRQIAADAMAGAVLEIDAGLPQELPRQRVDLRAGGTVGKHRAGDRDVAAQHG
jgi:hypothetical protein